MINLTGEKQFITTVEKLSALLFDLQNFVKVLPDVETIHEVSQDKAHILVAPGLAFLKGKLDTNIELNVVEKSITVASKGIGTFNKMKASFDIISVDDKVSLKWEMKVEELGGLLKLVPESLLKGSAMKIIDRLLENLEKNLNG